MSIFKKIGQFFKSVGTAIASWFRRSPNNPIQIVPEPESAPMPTSPPRREPSINRFFEANMSPLPIQAPVVRYISRKSRQLLYTIKPWKIMPWVQKQVNRWREREALRATEAIIQPAFFEEQKLKFEVAIHRAQIEFAEAFIRLNTRTISEEKQTELTAQYHAALEEISSDLLDNYKRNLSLDVRPHIVRNGKKITLTRKMRDEILHDYELTLKRDLRQHFSFRVLTLREARFIKDVLTTRIQSLDDRQYELFQKREAARMKMYDRDEEAARIIKESAEQATNGIGFFINQFKNPFRLLARHSVKNLSPSRVISTREKLERLKSRRRLQCLL